MENDKYLVPYLMAKNKYLAMTTWVKTCNNFNQQGGFTVKAGLYAVFYNKTELNNYLKINNDTREGAEIGVSLKGKKIFPSIDKLRKIIGINGWFVKEKSNVAERVNSPNAIFNFLKFIGTDVVYNKIASLYNTMHNKTIKGADIKKKINSPPISEVQLSEQLVFSKNNHNIEKLQMIANEINTKTNSKINAVFLVDVSRFTKNEMIIDISLNNVSNDIKPIESKIIEQLQDVSHATDQTKLQSAMTVAHGEMDNSSALKGGFFQCDINENILIGGSNNIKMNDFLAMFLLIIDFLGALDNGTLYVSTPSGNTINVSHVGKNLINTSPKASRTISPDHQRGGVLTNEQLNILFGKKPQNGGNDDEPNMDNYDEVD